MIIAFLCKIINVITNGVQVDSKYHAIARNMEILLWRRCIANGAVLKLKVSCTTILIAF